MLPLSVKVALFLALWFESARYFEMGADSAFLLTCAAFFGRRLVQALSVEFVGLSQPLTAELLSRGVMWWVIFALFGPTILKVQPVTVILAELAALAYAGARARHAFDARGYVLNKMFFYDRSDAVVTAVMSGLALAFTIQIKLGSVLPLAGFVAIFALPFGFGWTCAGPQPQTRFDASFGDENMWHDVGASDEY
jgi:hypothetical protein